MKSYPWTQWGLLSSLPCAALLLLGLSACDSTPNANFASHYEAAQSGGSDDPYAKLDETTRLDAYKYWKDDQRIINAAAESGRLRERYDQLLALLDKEPVQPALGDLAENCRRAFALATAFAKDPAQLTPEPSAIAQALQACRSQAVGISQKSDDKAVQAHVALLRRFASTGISLVGLSQMASGQIEPGLEIWRQGDALFEQDKSGFQMSLKAFRGW